MTTNKNLLPYIEVLQNKTEYIVHSLPQNLEIIDINVLIIIANILRMDTTVIRGEAAMCINEFLAKMVYRLIDNTNNIKSIPIIPRKNVYDYEKDSVEFRFITNIASIFDIHLLNSIEMKSRLVDDLGMDKLDEVEVVMSMEEEFNIGIDDKDMNSVSTVQDAIDLIKRKIKKHKNIKSNPARDRSVRPNFVKNTTKKKKN